MSVPYIWYREGFYRHVLPEDCRKPKLMILQKMMTIPSLKKVKKRRKIVKVTKKKSMILLNGFLLNEPALILLTVVQNLRFLYRCLLRIQ